MKHNDIVLGNAVVPGTTTTDSNDVIKLSGPNDLLLSQAINNYNSPKNVYGNQIDIDNAKNILGTEGFNYIYADSKTGFKKPTSFTSNDIILGCPTVTGILDSELNGAIRLSGKGKNEIANLIKNYSTAKNVFGPSIDIQNAKRYLGTTKYNYIETDQPGFIKPHAFSCNDIILGGPTVTNILDSELKGATRLAGQNRFETSKLIRNFAGVKHVICAKEDYENAKSILGTNGQYTFQNLSENPNLPATFDSSMIVLGGPTVTGITDDMLNGATRLWGADRALTAQAVNNYISPKYVYGVQVDIDNAKNILGTEGFTYIYTDSKIGFKIPTSFTSNDIILGEPSVTGITDDILNGAIRLGGKDT